MQCTATWGVIDEKDLDDLKLNPDEVDEVFLVNLDEIASYKPEVYETEVVQKIPESFPYDRVTGGKTYNWRKGRSYIPVYDMDGRVIWALRHASQRDSLKPLKKGWLIMFKIALCQIKGSFEKEKAWKQLRITLYMRLKTERR